MIILFLFLNYFVTDISSGYFIDASIFSMVFFHSFSFDLFCLILGQRNGLRMYVPGLRTFVNRLSIFSFSDQWIMSLYRPQSTKNYLTNDDFCNKMYDIIYLFYFDFRKG